MQPGIDRTVNPNHYVGACSVLESHGFQAAATASCFLFAVTGVSHGIDSRMTLLPLFVALTASVVAHYAVSPHQPREHNSLLKHSRKVAAVKSISSMDEHHWLNDSELLLVNAGGDDGKNRLDLLDIRTGHRRFLQALTRLYNQSRASDEIEIAPDGKHLVWLAYGERKSEWVTADLDGHELLRWTVARRSHVTHSGVTGSSYVRWLPDGRRIAEIVEDGDGLQADRILIITRDVGSGEQRNIRWNLPFSPDSTGWAAITTKSAVVLDTWSAPHYHYPLDRRIRDESLNRASDLHEWLLSNPSSFHRTWHVEAPQGAYIRNLKLSPNGSRLAWIVERNYRHWELYVSAKDGKGMSLLGVLPVDKGPWVTLTPTA